MTFTCSVLGALIVLFTQGLALGYAWGWFTNEYKETA